MSKKRSSSKKRGMVNKSVSSVKQHIIIDYTFDIFPKTLNTVSMNPMDIIQKWSQENAGPVCSIEELNRKMLVQQKKWNSLSLEEKNELMGNINKELRENSISFLNENASALFWHKSYFNDPFSGGVPTSEDEKDYIEFFKKYISSLKVWIEFLDKNQNYIIDLIDNGTTRNTLAAFVNMFTVAGLGNVGESFLNLIRTIWLRFGVVEDILWKYLPKIINFAINQERIAVDEFLDETEELSIVDDIFEELESPSHYSYRYISHTPHYQVLGRDEEIKFEILREFQRDYLSESDSFYLFSDFNSEADAVRINNLQKIEDIMSGKMSLRNNIITKNIHKDYGTFIAERIRYVRNMVLTNKEQIKDVFLNGNKDELRTACDWFNANTDKSIISGIFLLRDIFDEEDREEIIDLSIKAVIAHNSDLLKLNGIELTNWLVLGMRQS